MQEQPELKWSKGSFPNPLLPKEILNDPKTGLAAAKAIYDSAIDGENSYYAIRNAQFMERRTFAMGKQPFQSYLDLLGVDGKASFMNFDYHPRPVAPKFRNILVNDIMDKIEAPECTGLSLEMQQRKEAKVNEAAFRMEHGEFINQFQQTTGMQVVNQNDFTPENEDELELWTQLNTKEREELLMEYGVDAILYWNDWNSIKKEVTEDLVDVGLGCVKTYWDGRKMIRCKRIRPEYLIYGTTMTLNFRKVAYRGHVERISILDIRCMYPDYPEKKLWEFAYSFRQLNGNPNELSDFIIDFETAYTRPYDSWLVDVMFFEYNVQKSIEYIKGTDRNDNPIFEYSNRKPKGDKKKAYKTVIPTIYEGVWVMGSEDMMQWGEQQNLIRNNEDVEDLQSTYAIYMLNNDGDMLPKSPMDHIRSSIIQMDLTILRMQHTIATTPPNGVKMDIDAIKDLDLGTGLKNVGPMKMREIYQQIGDIYYSGSKISGEQGNKNPIEQMISSFGDKLKSYIEVYNFELNCIRDYLGINEVKDGTEVNPRIGLGVMQGQQQAANTATAHIYGGFISIMTDTVKSIAIMLWDALNTKETNKQYVRLLGKTNADFLRYQGDLTKTNYTTRISVNMSLEDIVFIEKTLDTSLQQGKIMPEDALMVRKYAKFNTEYAIRYMSLQTKKRMRDAQKAQLQQAQQQQQATAQQAQMMMQEKRVVEQQKSLGDIKKESVKGEYQHRNLIQQLINASMIELQQNGTPIPPYVQNLIELQVQAKINEQEQQIEQMENTLYSHDLQIMQMGNQQQGQQPKQQATA